MDRKAERYKLNAELTKFPHTSVLSSLSSAMLLSSRVDDNAGGGWQKREREMNISMEPNEHKTHAKVTWLLLS